jgi:hypothetical protein
MAAALFIEQESQAAKRTTELESYAFRSVKSGKGRRGRLHEGRYQKEQPLWLKTGSIEAFKKGGVVVAKEGEEYKKVEKAKKGAKKDASPAIAFFDVKLPHEQFEGIEKTFEKVEKAAEKDKDCTVWSGMLTAEGARGVASTGSKAEAKANLTYTGTAKVWINAQGMIVRYEASIDVKVRAGTEQGALATRRPPRSAPPRSSCPKRQKRRSKGSLRETVTGYGCLAPPECSLMWASIALA